MDLAAVVLTAAVLAVNLIGGTILVRWLVRTIKALESTVSAQGQTIATIGQINTTVLEVFKAMDPERWAKEVEIHKKLTDEKLEALLERKGREIEAQATEAREEAIRHLKNFVHLGIELIPYVPKHLRITVISGLAIPDDMKIVFLDYAEEVPDRGAGGSGLDSLLAVLAGTPPGLGEIGRTLQIPRPPDQPPGGAGGFNVR